MQNDNKEQLDLFGLSDKKKDAVSYTEEQNNFINYSGKCSIALLATAGSGKTFSCIKRVQKLIDMGVDPNKIIFFSFTNAAVDEFKTRLKNESVKVTTIHAFCYHILAKAGRARKILNFKDFIDWYKEKFKPRYANEKEQHEFEKKVHEMYEEMETISSKISAFKLQTSDGIKIPMPDYFMEYIAFQKEKKLQDFSDMLIEVEKLFREDKWLKMFKNKYDYIFIDEFQDTSTIQLKVLLCLNAKYYYLIGDENQCCIKGTKIDVFNENESFGVQNKNIEDVKVGDIVWSGNGGSRLVPKKVTKVYSKEYDGEVVKIKLKSGKIITTTPEHTHFADFNVNEQDLFFTYLMYKENFGFRIGVTRSKSKRAGKSGERFGFKNRLSGEHADKIWILKVSDTLAESIHYEKFYAAKYGIPTIVFVERNKGDIYSQGFINRLYKELSNFDRGFDVLKEFKYLFKTPHFVPKGNSRATKNININMCADGRTTNASHALTLGTDNRDHYSDLNKNGFLTFKTKGKNNWRHRRQSPNLGYIMESAKEIEEITKGHIQMCVNLKKGASLRLFPASQLLRGMTVYSINDKGEIIFDIIESCETENYKGFVYDINIENTHNFIANGVMTHNSIFGFSGSNSETLISMLSERRKLEKMTLTLNFRSDINIVENANKFSKLIATPTSKEMGDINYNILFDVDQLKDVLNSHQEVAILVRTNKTIKQLEKKMISLKYPLRYFNYITQQDVENFKKGEISTFLKRKINDLIPQFSSASDIFGFIELNKNSKKFITTIHKSKGREYDACVVVNSIDPNILKDADMNLPQKLHKKVSFIYDDEDREAQNIHYVAVTRPRHNLYYMLYGEL